MTDMAKSTQKKLTKKSLKNIAKKAGFAKFDVINLAVPERIDEVANMKGIQTPYVPFGVDNLLPQYLAEIKRKSPTHRAILGQKKILSIGQEFHSENEMLIKFIENVNIDESLRDVYARVIDDYYSFGNAYVQIVKHNTGINLYHIDATKCRVSKDQEYIYIHPDWSQYQSTKKDQVIIPIYPNFENNTSILQFKDYEPTFNYYGLPDFCAALEWIGIDNHLQKYNLTKFENNFTPSCIVEINGDMGEMEAETLVKEAQQKWTGQGNNSKILFLVKNGDTSPANITMLNDNADGSFMELQKLTSQNIITAHRWQPAMSGIVSSGKLSSTGSEIRVAWEMVMGTIIKDVEGVVLTKIKKVITENSGLETTDLQIVYEPPISYLSDIAPSSVLTVNEQRELLGFEFMEGGDIFLTSKTTK
jgi:phage portal protein BeeE